MQFGTSPMGYIMKDTEFAGYFRHTVRNSTSSLLSGYMLMLFDLVGLFLCIGAAFFLVNLINHEMLNFRSFVYYAVFFPLFILVYFLADLYPGIMVNPPEEVRRFAICNSMCLIAMCVGIAINEKLDLLEFTQSLVQDSSRRAVIYSLFLAIPFTIVGMVATREIGRHFYGHFDWWGVPAIIYSTDNSGQEIIERLQRHKYLGYHPCAVIDNGTAPQSVCSIPVFSPTQTLKDAIKSLDIKVAIICDYKGDLQELMNSYRYTIFVSKDQILSTSLQIRDLGGILGFSITHNLTWRSNLIIKRIFDILLIILSLGLTVPVMIVLSILIKATTPGPVFYTHKRVGRNGKILGCLKFRSMYNNSAEMLKEILATDPVRRAQWAAERKFIDDPRVTPFGKFLRKTSMDELPQIFNILKGEMSFVGPRPVTDEELIMYGKSAPFVLSVTPGLSGMWQVSGRSDTGYEERVSLDRYYIQNWSIWLDLWIIIRTVGVVLKGKGAY